MSNESIKKKTQKLFIEPLEQRIMLDGAGASTFLDLIDERNQQQIKINSSNKDIYKEGDNSNKDIPFTNITRDKIRNDKKNIVFIDSAVEDYETITSSFKENTEFYLINANEDGFKRISEILSDRENIDALHLIGHGSAGQILFGNAFLNNETIDNYKSTLTSIGQSLTTSGDILFYGCNVASTEQGEILIKKISEITKADIAASDDLTGKGGDWDLEKEEGFIETKSLNVRHYDHSLDTLTTTGVVSGSGVTHIASGNVDMLTSSQTKMGLGSNGIYSHISSPNTQYALALESSNVSVTSGKIISNIDIDATDTGLNTVNANGSTYISGDSNQTAGTNMTVNSYLVAYVGSENREETGEFGSAVFEGEIVGIFFDLAYTRGDNINSVQYHSSSFTYDMNDNNHIGNVDDSDKGRALENPDFYAYNYTSTNVNNNNDGTLNDWVSVGNYGSGTNNYLSFGFGNNSSNTGDYFRVLVKVNNDPVAVADTGYIQEGKTLTVADGASANDADMNFNMNDATGDHSGDIIGNDTDADSDSLTVTTYEHTSSAGQGGANTTPGSPASGTAGTDSVAGTYGTLDLDDDGSYTYTANSNITNLDTDEETFTDVFTYTVSDGNGGTDTATITITIEASGDVTAQNDTGTINEDATLTVSNNENTVAAASHDATFSLNSGVSNPYTGDPTSIRFNNDGTKMFIINEVSTNNEKIFEYNLSTAFDVTSASYSTSFTPGSNGAQDFEWPRSMAFNSDGTKIFVLGNDNSTIKLHEYTLSTPYSLSSLSDSSDPETSTNLTTILTSAGFSSSSVNFGNGVEFNNTGTKLFVSSFRNPNSIYEFSVSSAYDLSSGVSYTRSLDVSNEELAVQNIRFNNDGKKLFLIGSNGDDVNEYALSTGFDLSTATHSGSFSVSSQEDVPTGLAFNNDGTKMYVTGFTGEDVNEYSLTSPFSLINVSGEHSGDVISTSNTDTRDTDADSDTLTITSIIATTAGGNAQTTFSSNTETVTGSYGTLTINSSGTYEYAATLDATDALDAGDIVTDVFTYIVSDGNGETDTATITITIIGINDAPTAVADTDSVDAGSTVTDTTNSAGTLILDDTDADASSSLYITKITGNGNSSDVTYNSTKSSNAATIDGSKGTLTFGSDGSYSYAANSNATKGTDVFTYTLTDGTSETTATLTITISNNAPTASNSTVYINENNQVSSAGDRTPSNITKIFAASDFNYSDQDSDSLSKVKITTLESAGALEHYNGSSWVDVTENQEITASDIGNNYLRFTPAANSESNPTFGFKVHDGTEYSSSAYTMTISVNAAPNVTDTTVGSTVSAGGTSSGDVHDGVADSDDADSVLVVTGVASGNESSNNTIVTNNTGVGSAVSGTYGSLNIAANGTYTYTASSSNNIAHGSTATDTFTFTTRDDETNSGSFAYDVGTITFTVASSGSAPVARNDTGNINVGGTLTVSNSSNATDVDTATFSSSNSESIAGQSGQSTGVVFNDDGTKMYISDSSNGRIYEYPLSTAFDVSTAGSSSYFIHNVSNANSVSFNNDGTKLFILDLSNVRSYDLTTGFDVTSQSGSATTYSLSLQETSMRGLTFNNDGTKMFTVGTNNDKVYEYTLSSAFDLSSTVTYIDSLSVQSQDSYPTEIKFNHDGTKMYIAGNGQDINEYTLSTAFDISSTVTHKGSYSVSSVRYNCVWFFF